MVAIYEKMKNNYYRNTENKYPDKKDYKSIKKCDCCGVEKENYDEIGYKEHRDRYNAEVNKLHDEFIRDCFEYHGIENHPCRFIIFSKAWEEGHSSGHHEVFNCMHRIIDFVEQIEKALKNG